MVDRHTAKQRSFNMSRIRGKGTTPEKIVRSLLRAEGYRYRSNVPGLPGRPDIVLASYRTVIFVHGCFWHRHKNCRYSTTPKSNAHFWEDKFEKTILRDRQKSRDLRKRGWRIIVIWECAIRSSRRSVVKKVSRALKGQAQKEKATKSIS